MTHALRRLVLHDRHVAAGARFVPFAGWEMPLQYGGILQEHAAVRERAGVFDVSHLGRVRLRAADASALRALTTYDVTGLPPGAAHYSLYCTPEGGIADDVFIYRLATDDWLIVHNAANAIAGFERVRTAFGADAREITDETVMLALQGPTALGHLHAVLGAEVTRLAPQTVQAFPFAHGTLLVARTGYTGEDGVECTTDAATAGLLWDALLARGVTPAGLGARDTLRLEAALPLHGHDLDAGTHPFEAGLGWAVTLDDGRPFIGRAALVDVKSRPLTRRLAHLRSDVRAVLRAGYEVRSVDGAACLATLSSGAFSPTLRVGIGMAYLPVAFARPGARLVVDLRGAPVPVEVVRRPFYRRPA